MEGCRRHFISSGNDLSFEKSKLGLDMFLSRKINACVRVCVCVCVGGYRMNKKEVQTVCVLSSCVYARVCRHGEELVSK